MRMARANLWYDNEEILGGKINVCGVNVRCNAMEFRGVASSSVGCDLDSFGNSNVS